MADGNDAERAAVVEFWRKIELFSPPDVPRVDPREHVYRVEPGEPLPWEEGHRLRDIKLPPRQTWQYSVYCGVYELERMYRVLEDACGRDRNSYNERAPGRSAVAAFVVNAEGLPLLGSQVLSTCGWGVGRTIKLGTRHPQWLEGFDDAATVFGKLLTALAAREYALDRAVRAAALALPARKEFRELLEPAALLAESSGGVAGLVSALDELFAAAPGEDGEPAPSAILPVTRSALRVCTAAAVRMLGLESVLAPERLEVRIQCKRVSVRRAEDAGGLDFLNSFIAGDLKRIAKRIAAGDCAEATRSYLTERIAVTRRVDVREDLVAVQEATAPAAIAAGRWPGRSDRPLALNQQLAVDEAMRRLGRAEGVLTVNGPPGTGKTTLLRDLVAAVVTERARVLSSLAKPEDAFVGEYKWNVGKYVQKVPKWTPRLCGFELVMAATTNGAVENITAEIPGAGAIDDEWRERVDYFGDIADSVVNADKLDDYQRDGVKRGWREAWGLIAAKLGKSANRGEFAKAFWFGVKESKTRDGTVVPELPGMMRVLKDWTRSSPEQSWREAVDRFRQAEKHVEKLRRERGECVRIDQHVVETVQRRELLRRSHADLEQRVVGQQRRLGGGRERRDRARCGLRSAQAARLDHRKLRPGFVEALFTVGGAVREWRAADRELADAVAAAHLDEKQSEEAVASLEAELTSSYQDLDWLNGRLRDADDTLEYLRREKDRLRERLGESYPDQRYWTDRSVRERRAPWSDPEFNAARTSLFLAALALHRDFLRHAASRMLPGLRAAVGVMQGLRPRGLPEEAVRAAWQTQFFVVPVVSTTFASLPRLFDGLGPGALGWFIVDEAGQATPQGAVGGLWCSRRLVAVGDPLQLEPVITLPFTVQEALRGHDGVAEKWTPERTSAQRLADEVTELGAELKGPDGGGLWVGVPLSVHRRCDDPMFSLVNETVYGGAMVLGEMERDPLVFPGNGLAVPNSKWIHIAGEPDGSHWIPAEGDELDAMLKYMKDNGQDMTEVFLLSPFRSVASRLYRRSRSFPGMRAGTVHRAQGREADIVVFVLGGDPAKPRAREWAAERPNLFNVAVSRAKRRLYVIGNRDLWQRLPYFQSLANRLPVLDRATTNSAP
ncbi:MAG: AAA domain-containing protein [Stackebrandtia sp.]